MPKPFLLSLLLCSPLSWGQLGPLGGDTTTSRSGKHAFSQPAANLPLMQKVDFSVGNSFFKNPWVIAPSSTTARDGLGPLFNTNGCQSCHIKDGRGHAPKGPEDKAISMLVRLSIAANTPEQQARQVKLGPIGEPSYGGQIQDMANPGIAAEARIEVRWRYETRTLKDGTQVQLRRPDLTLADLAYGDLHADTQFSMRVAPPMIGLGLLEQVPEAQILERADEQDANGDGISGKANWVWDVRAQQASLGRFGWKAGMPNLEQQNAAAFNGDLGITSDLFPKDHCTQAQQACQTAPHGGLPELQPEVLESVTFYSRHLAVPKQRIQDSQQVAKGLALFEQIGCEQCHRSTLTTAKNPQLSALSEQRFHPFTDLLLHDMGDDLADQRPEFLANGREWRTPPLWGLGYYLEVNGHQQLLHDGRARNIEEAILWHGGEAQSSNDAYQALSQLQRQQLLDFLNSL